MGCGGADIGEDADVSGDVDLGGGEARFLVRYRFPRVCGEFWEDLPNSFPFSLYFSRNMFLVRLKRGSGGCG